MGFKPPDGERTFIAEIDPCELMCRMMEAGHGIPRPVGVTPRELIRELEPESRDPLHRMAQAAVRYLTECLESAKVVDP